MPTTGTIGIQVVDAQGANTNIGELEIGLTPSRTTKGELRHQPHPRAAMIHDPDKEAVKDKDYALYGRVKNKTFKSKLLESKSPHSERLEKQIEGLWKSGNALLGKYWERSNNVEISLGHMFMSYGGRKLKQSDFRDKILGAIQKSHPRASDIAINFSDMSVRFREGNDFKEIKTEELPQEAKEIIEFLNLWQEAHESAMAIMNIRSWHTRLGTDSNRPVHGEKPFAIENNPVWDDFIPKTHDAFVKDHALSKSHLTTLLENVPSDRKAGAYHRIRQAHKFIEEMKRQINEKIRVNSDAPESEMAHLKKIKENLEAINIYAVYWAASFWNSAEITAENQSKTAQDVTNKLLEVFNDTRSIAKDKWAIDPRLALPMLTGRNKPSEDDLKSFAIQVGDLYFHSDLDYLTRFDSTGAKRMVRPSLEEFVIHNMMRLREADYVDDLESFGTNTLSPEQQVQLRQIIQAARTASR